MTSWLIRFEQNPFVRIIIDRIDSANWRTEVQMMDIAGVWAAQRVSTGQRAYQDALHYGVAA